MDLLLDVEGRRVDDEIAPILLVLPPPHELRIQIPVAALVRHPHRTRFVLVENGLELRRRDILALGFVVPDGLDGLADGLGARPFRRLLGCHRHRPRATAWTAVSTIFPNSASTFALKSDSI